MDRWGSTTTDRGTSTKATTTEQYCPAGGAVDRLSVLPDELLLFILSFLSIRQAVSTSWLSRRWRCLYRHLPSLDFRDVQYFHPPPPWFIDRVLLLHAAPTIESFCPRIHVIVGRDKEASSSSSTSRRDLYRQLDSWLLFVVRRGVRVLHLGIDAEPTNDAPEDFEGSTYGMPPWVFHCETLEKFSAVHCHLCLPSHVRLISLKKMEFNLAVLGNDALRCLLRGCRLLQSLQLEGCNEEMDLIIDARESRNLEELVIGDRLWYERDPNDNDTQIQIDAPSVKYLMFRTTSIRWQYTMVDLSSVVVARFEFVMRWEYLHGIEVDLFTTHLMLRINHQVQELKLCGISMEARQKQPSKMVFLT